VCGLYAQGTHETEKLAPGKAVSGPANALGFGNPPPKELRKRKNTARFSVAPTGGAEEPNYTLLGSAKELATNPSRLLIA
jgi:hypothetical protein